MKFRTSLRILLLLIISSPWTQGLAQEPVITELTPVDLQYMAQQRQSLQEIAARHLGRSFSRQRERDLDILQALLDKGLVRNSQKRELQAMGIILGDYLARDLDMQWVIYEDKHGRSRALRLGETDNFLFPVTMISRRREVDNEQPVVEIYQKAKATITKAKEPLPFQ